ncbi:MAG: Pycsar system effector family protein [Egibacteraceae bacterium]
MTQPGTHVIRHGHAPTEAAEQPDRTRAVAYAERLLATGREELHRVDTKASILFASASAVIVTFMAASLAGGWSPTRLAGPRLLLWWAGTAVACVAVVLMGAALYPRTRGTGHGDPPITFYGDVARFADSTALRAALERSADREFEQLTDQLMRVSQLVGLKYRLLAMSMWALLISAVCCGLAVAFG